MSDTGDQKNGSCGWCGEETPVEDLRDNDFGVLGLHKVCPACYEELKNEFGIIGEEGLQFFHHTGD